MPALATSDIQQVIKELYPTGVPLEVMYKKTPGLALIPKDEGWSGELTKIPLMWGNPQGRSATLSTAIANKMASKWAGFDVTCVDDYAVWGITGKAIAQTRNDEGSFVRHMKAEMDGAMNQLKRSMVHALWRNGGGALGQIASGQATPTITLVNKWDVVFFEVGQVLNVSATDGTSGAIRAGTVTVTAVDRTNGTVTASGNWTAGIAAAAANDFIFVNGDFGLKLVGMDAWIPASAPGATAFFGVARNADPVRLGGTRLTAAALNKPIDEIAMDLLDEVNTNGGSTDVILIHNRQWTNLEKRLHTRVQYGTREVEAGSVKIGFRTIKITGPGGDVDVIADSSVQPDTMWALQLDTWTLGSLGTLFDMLDDDKLPYLRVSTSDEIEGRLVSRPGLACKAPGWNGRATLPTVNL